MSEITHEQASERKQNIITKQIALSSDIYSVRLIPISADETNIKEIQDFIDKQEELEKEYSACVKHLKLVELHSNSKDEIIEKQQKLLELYKRLNKVQTRLSWYKIHTINRDKIEKYEREVFDITKQIKELENGN